MATQILNKIWPERHFECSLFGRNAAPSFEERSESIARTLKRRTLQHLALSGLLIVLCICMIGSMPGCLPVVLAASIGALVDRMIDVVCIEFRHRRRICDVPVRQFLALEKERTEERILQTRRNDISNAWVIFPAMFVLVYGIRLHSFELLSFFATLMIYVIHTFRRNSETARETLAPYLKELKRLLSERTSPESTA